MSESESEIVGSTRGDPEDALAPPGVHGIPVAAANSGAAPVAYGFGRLRLILEMIRFSHTLFALPFALLSAGLAWRENARAGVPFRAQELVGILLCMVFARSAAMAFNRLADRHLDAHNPRTANRHLPAGTLSVTSVRLFLLTCCLAFIASTLLFWPNRLPLYLSLPVLGFLLGYSYAKRFTSFCHYWLAAALMLAPIAAWIAIRGDVTWTPILLGASVFFWVGGFDIIYACQDTEYDKGAGLFSIPARVGVGNALRIALVSHLLMLACLIGLWKAASLGTPFAIAVGLVAVLLTYEHACVSPRDLTRVNIAFFHVNSIISVALLVLGLVDAWVFSR